MNEHKEYLKRDLNVSDEEYQQMVQSEIEKEKANPNSITNANKNIVFLKDETSELDSRTTGMQFIDDFTLGKTENLEEKSEGLQAIDDFTLSLVTELQTKIDTLEQRILTLEGGN